MNDTKFTKGVWKVGVSRGSYSVSSQEDKTYSSRICDLTYYGNNKENSHLIAAAPDMYELLDNIRILCEWGHNEIELADEILIKLDEIKDQLKKARGD